MSRRRERGAALLAATAALGVLSIIAVGFASSAIVEQHLCRNAVEAARAEALARSGIATAVVVLESRDPAEPDLATSQWIFPRQALGGGWVEVAAEDEARRLDVHAPELPRLLAVLGVDDRRAAALAAPDRERVIGPHLGDVAAGAGFDAAAIVRLADHVTVSGEHLVNLHTASPEVLLALANDPGIVRYWQQTRAAGAIDPASVPSALAGRVTVRGQYYRLRSTAGVGEARRSIEAIVRIVEGAEPDIVSWRAVTPEDSPHAPASRIARRGDAVPR